MKYLLVLLSIAACAPKQELNCYFHTIGSQRAHLPLDSRPIYFQIHENVPEEFRATIHEAAAVWKSKSGSPLIKISENIYSGPNGKNLDNSNVIYYTDIKTGELGRATVWYAGASIVESDILMDNKIKSLSTFKIVMIHEFGHALGLKHNDVEKSIMTTYHDPAVSLPTNNDFNNLKCEY